MACSSENQWLDTALNLAGDNRAELQKVLDRYKEEDGDKYRAACFLIENMPFHGAYEGKALENYRKYFSEYVSFPYSRHVQELIDSLKRADGEFSINQLTYKRDIMTVDSAFLVNHIEWAFKVWRRNLQVARVAQADGDGVKAFMEGLQLRIGRPVVTDKVYRPHMDKADPDAKEQLMQIFGRG